MRHVFHLNSAGGKVFFRDWQDYVIINNRIAGLAYAHGLTVTAASIMSTHFHLVVETSDPAAVDEFVSRLRRSYSIHYSCRRKHRAKDMLKIEKREKTGRNEAYKALRYVMRNPVHHYLKEYPPAYSFSSARFMFMEEMMCKDILQDWLMSCRKISELGYREKATFLARMDLPGDWLVDRHGMILPCSYVNIHRAETYWPGGFKTFLNDMTGDCRDRMNEIIDDDNLSTAVRGLSDIDACAIIDDYAAKLGLPSFHHLDIRDINTLMTILRDRGADFGQIRRCLWIRSSR